MHHVIVAWANKSTEEFESQVPLQFIAGRYRALGFQAPFEVVILSGYENLDANYRSSLSELGFEVRDASSIFSEVHREFPALDRFRRYEVYCFLRWLVLRRIFGSDPLVHYDGDVVLNVPPEELATRLSGSSFVLQGSPAFTVISHSEWYDQLDYSLKELAADIDGYSARAWREREGWKDSFDNKWAGSRDRPIISSDQDLVSHLIHTDRLRQTSKSELLNRLQSWIAIENPLYPDACYDLKRVEYSRVNGVDCFDSRPLMIWHMQTAFHLYLARQLVQTRFLPLFARGRLARDMGRSERVSYRAVGKLTGHRSTTRRAIYERFFGETDFSSILDDRRWWKPGVFR